MAPTYQVSDIVRIQTIVNALLNEASWTYITHPDAVDEITDVLGESLRDVKDIGLRASGYVVCPTGYCRSGAVCQPCQIPMPRDPENRRPESAKVEAGDGSRRRKAVTARRGRSERSPQRRVG